MWVVSVQVLFLGNLYNLSICCYLFEQHCYRIVCNFDINSYVQHYRL